MEHSKSLSLNPQNPTVRSKPGSPLKTVPRPATANVAAVKAGFPELTLSRNGSGNSDRPRRQVERDGHIRPNPYKAARASESKGEAGSIAGMENVCKNYRVFTNRVYLTGLSMSGEGTFSTAAAHPLFRPEPPR